LIADDAGFGLRGGETFLHLAQLALELGVQFPPVLAHYGQSMAGGPLASKLNGRNKLPLLAGP
jgi:hypothetical protein